MPCYRPLTAWRSASGQLPTGKWPLVFQLKNGIRKTEVQVPCGQCIGCRLERSRQWAIRCVHEAQMHPKNCFLTLTYDNQNVNKQYSLDKRDLQLFWKKLRKELDKNGKKIRYFACGEYGENFDRPHYHACLFGHMPHDMDRISDTLGTDEKITEIWSKGFVLIGQLTFESAAYVARYCTKKITGEAAKYHYDGREPEFVLMSRRPGIGRSWYDKYKSDLYPNDQCVIRNGLIVRPAKYYDKLYDCDNAATLELIKKNRLKNINKLDNTKNRLKCKEKLSQLQLKKTRRYYEQQ